MRKQLVFRTWIVMILLLAACTAAPANSPLVGTWSLQSFGSVSAPQAALPEISANLTFSDKGQVSGSMGCNSFGGGYSLRDSKIVFEPLTSTLMACEEAVMNQEAAVLQMLAGEVEYTLENNTLTLRSGDQMLVLQAQK
ncbi:META domain-containing protein [Levilinea saccharolytica]|nr:META domain-containing protein [Levilinea saccharolytica]GAP16411.1 heat shock protein [Levilinea saccharolytica]